ncbi:hypothetical protein CBER1_09084 [Cercospora berteroae]|uniref:Uncharacterized protein n=1 Tax=Cercospora berteroae TaxID=357750 RepID=A0A2S6C8X3_9PEZI|nr:hypothetical protein CBER1_09084 [Cercospora berteroae]
MRLLNSKTYLMALATILTTTQAKAMAHETCLEACEAYGRSPNLDNLLQSSIPNIAVEESFQALWEKQLSDQLICTIKCFDADDAEWEEVEEAWQEQPRALRWLLRTAGLETIVRQIAVVSSGVARAIAARERVQEKWDEWWAERERMARKTDVMAAEDWSD